LTFFTFVVHQNLTSWIPIVYPFALTLRFTSYPFALFFFILPVCGSVDPPPFSYTYLFSPESGHAVLDFWYFFLSERCHWTPFPFSPFDHRLLARALNPLSLFFTFLEFDKHLSFLDFSLPPT